MVLLSKEVIREILFDLELKENEKILINIFKQLPLDTLYKIQIYFYTIEPFPIIYDNTEINKNKLISLLIELSENNPEIMYRTFVRFVKVDKK